MKTPTTINKKEKVRIFWFKRDLRTHDHGPLEIWEKISKNNNSEDIHNIGLYVIENGYWNSDKASMSQKSFVLECVTELKDNLEKIGAELLIMKDHSALEVFKTLITCFDIREIICHRETGNKWTFDRDIQVMKFSKQHNIELIEIAQDCLVRAAITKQNDFSTRYYDFVNMPQFVIPKILRSPTKQKLESIFTPEIKAKVICPRRELLNTPTESTLRQTGGESLAVENLLSFMQERCLGTKEGYRKEMSIPLSAHSACSRISAHLSWGSLSARAAYQTANQALKLMDHYDQRVKNIQSFITRLAWRSHFMQKFETLHWMEFKCLNRNSENLHSWDQEAFEAWSQGMTGYPFIDACMRSLSHTKWLNFRARAMVVSFASYALNLDWRGFGPYLAKNFLDYEPGIHYSQLQMQGGTTLGSPPRIYSPLKQSVEKDPTGEFIRLWVPELKDCPDSIIHLPSDYPRNGYPASIVDHTRLWSIMRSNAPQSPKQFSRKTITKRVTNVTNKIETPKHHSNQLELGLELSPNLNPRSTQNLKSRLVQN